MSPLQGLLPLATTARRRGSPSLPSIRLSVRHLFRVSQGPAWKLLFLRSLEPSSLSLLLVSLVGRQKQGTRAWGPRGP